MSGGHSKLCLHHVGGRGGSRVFPCLPQFEPDLINVLYEADRACLEQIRERNRSLASELHVLPYCLADRAGTATLHVNYDPFTSSLLEANPEYAAAYSRQSEPVVHDYVWGEVSQSRERVTLQTCTLDEVIERHAGQIPPPDFLSIDTQGSEYAILSGAGQALARHVLALAIEVEFHPIYKDQKLFGDLCSLLSGHGFHFVKFLSIEQMSPCRSSSGLRGEGFDAYGDALFLKRFDRVDSSDQATWTRQMRKLAFISVLFHQFEYGLECLRRVSEKAESPASGREPLDAAYLTFLADLSRAVSRMPVSQPPTFAQVWSFEASKARFAPEAAAPVPLEASGRVVPVATGSFRNRMKRLLARWPFLLSFVQRSRRAWREFRQADVPAGEDPGERPSPVEELLERVGLEDLSRLIQKNRIHYAAASSGSARK